MATWNKNEPSGDVLGSAIPSYIRELKDYFEDAFGREHSFPPDGSSDGQHKVDEIAPCQVVEDSSSLDLEDGGIGYCIEDQSFYVKDGDTLYKVNEALTTNDIPIGSVMLFYQSTAPTGWSIVSGYDDRMVIVRSSVSSETGGSWTAKVAELGHSHSGTVTHYHSLPFGEDGAVDFDMIDDYRTEIWMLGRLLYHSSKTQDLKFLKTSSVTADVTAETEAAGLYLDGSWRPKYLACILCQYDG